MQNHSGNHTNPNVKNQTNTQIIVSKHSSVCVHYISIHAIHNLESHTMELAAVVCLQYNAQWELEYTTKRDEKQTIVLT